MERRKDTPLRGERLPREYLDIISSVFTKNFASYLKGRGKTREAFIVFGEIYTDEVLIAVSLKNPANLRMTTCYSSMDYPPASLMGESGSSQLMAASASDAVQMTVNTCVDVMGSFFQSFFDEDRPVEFDTQNTQDWSIVEVDKTTKVYIRINRDNLELEAASDEFLAQHEAMEDRAMQEHEDDGANQEMQEAFGQGESGPNAEADDSDEEIYDDEVEDDEPTDEDEEEEEQEVIPVATKETTKNKPTRNPAAQNNKSKKRTIN